MKYHKSEIAFLAILLSGCNPTEPNSIQNISIDVRRDLLPDNIILSVTNNGERIACIPIAETRLGGGFVTLAPTELTPNANRPTPIMIDGIDVSEGVFVIEPRKTQQIYVNLSFPGANQATSIRGEIRSINCLSLFGSGSKIPIKMHFETKL